MVTMGGVRAAEDAKYPDWKGQWAQILTPGLEGQMVKFDPTKPWGRGQQAPLTPEYQKVHEDSMADQPTADSATTRPPGVCRAACRA